MPRLNHILKACVVGGLGAVALANAGISHALPASAEFEPTEAKWLAEVKVKLKSGGGLSLPEESDWTLATRLSDRTSWVFWPELASNGDLTYRAQAALSETAAQCVAVSLVAVSRQAAAFSEHQVSNRSVEMGLGCAGKSVLTKATAQAKGWKVTTAVDGSVIFEGELAYTPAAKRPTGLDYERQLVSSAGFEENPRANLDYAEALQSAWAQKQSQPASLTCWSALWGSSHRQCVGQLPELGPRQCAVMALKSAYRDVQEKTDAGLPPHHSLELQMWCGQNRARVRVGREHRIDVEWWRGQQAASEMSVAISRRLPVPLAKQSGEYERYVSQVNARDGAQADKLKESYERATRLAAWVGGAGPRNADSLRRSIEGLDVKCQAASVGQTCQAKTSASGGECREVAFAAAYVAPLAKGPLAGKRDFKMVLSCGDGQSVEVVRDFDHLQGKQMRGQDILWSESLELLRAVN